MLRQKTFVLYLKMGKPKTAFQNQANAIEAVSRLFRLRNKTTHYTPENAASLKVTINELFNLWNHTRKLLAYFHSREQFTNDGFEDLLRKTDHIVWGEMV